MQVGMVAKQGPTFYRSSFSLKKSLSCNNAFWPTAVAGEADSVSSVSASACHSSGPKGVSPGQKALLHGVAASRKENLNLYPLAW